MHFVAYKGSSDFFEGEVATKSGLLCRFCGRLDRLVIDLSRRAAVSGV